MLSWSSQTAGHTADVRALSDPTASAESGLPHGAELLAFAEAIAGWDDGAPQQARERLVSVAGRAFMVDAAAVAANFEMMTRVADGTGARFPADVLAERAGLTSALGVDGFASTRRSAR